MINYDPHRKPAIAYRTASSAFKDADYANCIEHVKQGITVTPYFTLALTCLLICATILLYFMKG